MEYRLFLDTNALLNLGENAFKEKFIIAQKTLEEIENIKVSNSKDGEIKYKARQISRLLDKNDGEYEVVLYSPKIKDIIDSYFLSETPDNIILASAYYYNLNVSKVLVCSDDLNCKFISRNIFELPTKGVSDINLVKNLDEYLGYKELTLSDEEMSYFYCHTNENIYDCILNEYLIIKKSDGEVVDYRKWDGFEYKAVCEKTVRSTIFGDKIRPKDSYQTCAIDSIFSNTMTAITGHAGSGKSLISLISMMSLIENGEYDRVIIMFNPNKAKGAADMGFYCGDSTEKALQNSIGSMLTTKFGDRFAVEMLLQQDKIRLVSMADVRGMEVRDNEILYISEAQNTSIELLKLCLSRASSGCKIVIEGDYDSQVDSYLFEGNSNGFKRAIDVLQGESEFGYVHLPNVWRSKIAMLVDKL
ncbi:hypothetical protein F290043J8_19460 [Mediterraneibacter gnavus]|uniref:PhoH family protein n=1 Tax=Mediterraneibacter gnavus TaxID=33038 RepID=UPI0034B2B6CB